MPTSIDTSVGRRHLPPVPKFSILFKGSGGQVLEDYIRHLRDFYSGLPAPHAHTHKRPFGTDDSVSGQGLPSPITFGQVGQVGDPFEGFSTRGHVHDTTALGPLEDLLDLDVGPNGVPVTDAGLHRALEAILAKLLDLLDLLLKLVDLMGRSNVVPTTSIVYPPIAASTASKLVMPAQRQRIGATIYNDAASVLFLKYGPGASPTSFTYRVAGNTQWDMPPTQRYVGEIHAASGAGVGDCKPTDLVRLY